MWSFRHSSTITAPAKITMRLILLIFAAVAIAALTSGIVLGQEPQPEAASPALAPSEAMSPPPPPRNVTLPASMPPAIAPSEVTPPLPPPRNVTSPESMPPEIAPPVPGKDDAAANDSLGLGMGEMGMGMGGMGMGGMGGMGMGRGGVAGLGYAATWYPSRPASGSAPEGEFGLVRQSLSFGEPVWRDGGNMVMLSASVRESMFFTDAVLPDFHRSFPDDLWNVSLGTMFLHKFDNGWSGGLGVNFGSASDQPFHSIHELNAGFMSFLQIPVWDARDAWRFAS